MQFLGIIVSARIIIWQVGRQSRISLQLQKENSRENLKLQIYEVIKKHMESVSDAVVDAGIYTFAVPSAFSNHQFMLEQGISASPIAKRASVFLEYDSKLHNSVTSLSRTLEGYEIVNPHLRIFRIALSSALHDLRNASAALYPELLRFLPIDVPEDRIQEVGTRIVERQLPNEVQFANIEKLVNQYKATADDIGCYIHDLKVEAQNLFLGDLFGNRLPRRQPMDSKHKVITTDSRSLQELERYFEEETEHGKYQSQIKRKMQENKRE